MHEQCAEPYTKAPLPSIALHQAWLPAVSLAVLTSLPSVTAADR